MRIDTENRVPLWHLARNTGIPRRELVPILQEIGLPIDVDLPTGNVYTDKTELGELFRSIAAGAA